MPSVRGCSSSPWPSWHLWDADVDGPRLNVLAVNLSARQMDEPDTSNVIRNVLARYGVDPARVCFELTESAVMTQSVSTREALATFRELGVRVAIDDFGTGYSSLAYLHTLPVSTLKIDRSLYRAAGQSGRRLGTGGPSCHRYGPRNGLAGHC